MVFIYTYIVCLTRSFLDKFVCFDFSKGIRRDSEVSWCGHWRNKDRSLHWG